MQKDATMEDMKTMSYCLTKLKQEGYEDDFKITGNGLCTMDEKNCYQPEEVSIVNFFRFEGASDPADNSILFVIETADGKKGTLTDAFGPYGDEKIDKFIKAVEDINKKNSKDDTTENG